MQAGMDESGEYRILECRNLEGCAKLGNLYIILTIIAIINSTNLIEILLFVTNESTKEGKNKSAITKGTEWAEMRR